MPESRVSAERRASSHPSSVLPRNSQWRSRVKRRDPIIDEIRAHREEFARAHDYDVPPDARDSQARAGRQRTQDRDVAPKVGQAAHEEGFVDGLPNKTGTTSLARFVEERGGPGEEGPPCTGGGRDFFGQEGSERRENEERSERMLAYERRVGLLLPCAVLARSAPRGREEPARAYGGVLDRAPLGVGAHCTDVVRRDIRLYGTGIAGQRARPSPGIHAAVAFSRG